jgi:hypothetical protein
MVLKLGKPFEVTKYHFGKTYSIKLIGSDQIYNAFNGIYMETFRPTMCKVIILFESEWRSFCG